MAITIQRSIHTLRLKVKAEGYAWLNEAAIEANDVWNFANATSYKAARPFAGPSKWLTAFDLNNLTAGATKHFKRIGSATIQRINAEFVTRRKQFKRVKLRWRPSSGPRRALGWIPFKAEQLKRKGKCLRFSGKAFRVFERELLENARWNRSIEQKIANAQRRGHKRQAKRLHRTGARRRKDALHKFSRKIVNDYQTIVVGDVSSIRLRTWICRECGVTHDRDVNAARNILSAARLPPSVSGNESSLSVAEPTSTYDRREAGISAMKAAA